MTQEEKRIKIAEACGWTRGEDPDFPWVNHTTGKWTKPLNWRTLPNYFEDLNACHEMEKVLPDRLSSLYHTALYNKGVAKEAYGIEGYTLHSSANMRSECFGLTMGLWKEGE